MIRTSILGRHPIPLVKDNLANAPLASLFNISHPRPAQSHFLHLAHQLRPTSSPPRRPASGSTTVKEKIVFRHDLPNLQCDFAWDTETLQKRIKVYKPDYNPKDPWTWPTLSSMQPGSDTMRFRLSSLPQGVVHSRQMLPAHSSTSSSVKIKQGLRGLQPALPVQLRWGWTAEG